MTLENTVSTAIAPILLYDGGCATCRRIAHWVHLLASGNTGHPSIVDRPVGDDPEALRKLNPNLDIWDAYAVVHVVMPDGSMRLGGEAVAEVLRRLPKTRWFARCFNINVLGKRPFQSALNLAYTVLDDIRPLLGCASCGRPQRWVRPITRLATWLKSRFGRLPHPNRRAHRCGRRAAGADFERATGAGDSVCVRAGRSDDYDHSGDTVASADGGVSFHATTQH